MTAAKAKTDESFLPDGYKLPDSSGYMKFVQGDNKFRILSSSVTGWEYWTTDDKPVRSQTEFESTPNIKVEKDGKTNINYFWAVVVYNYDAGKIQTLQITQKGIQKYILGLVNNKAWGTPKGYDLVVTRSGSGLETKYSTVANPHSPLEEGIAEKFEKAGIDLEALMFDSEE